MGLFGASILFLVGAWQNTQQVCDFPGTEECQFQLSTAAQVARLQSLTALGLSAIGAGLYLVVRKRKSLS